VDREGLEGRVRIELRDYRDLPEAARYDRVVSVGMFEHIGLENFPTYFSTVKRVLKPGGLFFARLASTIGLEVRLRWLDGRRARLPDGSERFVVDERFLLDWTDSLSGRLIEPLKTTNVQNQRCMTTWVLEK
jgi:SAM-dependent methyltransferase